MFHVLSDELVFSRHDTKEEAKAEITKQCEKALKEIEEHHNQISGWENFMTGFTIKEEQ